MGFDKCDSTPVQDYNGDNAKEHLLPQSYHVNRQKKIYPALGPTCREVEVGIPNSVLKEEY